jgi:hypothetical protein
MSKWNEIKKNLGIIADKTATKTRELTDAASLKIKIAAKESERDTEYKVLGKLTYKKLKNAEGSDDASLTAHISNTIERLDKIHTELAALFAEEEARRAAKEAEKQAKEQARREAEQKEEQEQEELNRQFMDDFNAARKQADEAYKEAKKSAEQAGEAK